LTVPKMEWTLVPSIVTISFTLSNNINYTTPENIRQQLTQASLLIESFEIQDEGDMTFEFLDFKIYNWTPAFPEVVVDPPVTIKLKQNSRIVIGSSYKDLYEQPKGIIRYEIGDVNNTEVYKTSLSYYDSPERLAVSQLFITVSGVDYPTIGEWTDPDSELTLPIEELMMKTLLSLRKLPGRIYHMSVFFKNNTMLNFSNQIVINDVVHILLDREMKGNVDGYTHYDITLWEVVKDFDGINIVDTGTPEVSLPPYPSPHTGFGSMFPGAPGAGGVEYFEMFTNVTTNYVDCAYSLSALVNLSNEYAINTKWRFIVSGSEALYKASGTLTPGEYRFDLTNNRFLFGKGSGSVRWIKIMKMY